MYPTKTHIRLAQYPAMGSVLRSGGCPAGPTGNNSKYPSFRCSVRPDCESCMLDSSMGTYHVGNQNYQRLETWRAVPYKDLSLKTHSWRASPEVGELRPQQMYLFQCVEKSVRLDCEKKNKFIFILRNSWKFKKKYDKKEKPPFL